MTAESLPAGTMPKKKRGLELTERHLPLALLLPSFLIILLVIGFPMIYSLYISLTGYTLTTPRLDFVGFQNYITLLTKDPLFWKAFGRTVLFISLAVNLEFLIGLGPRRDVRVSPSSAVHEIL